MSLFIRLSCFMLLVAVLFGSVFASAHQAILDHASPSLAQKSNTLGTFKQQFASLLQEPPTGKSSDSSATEETSTTESPTSAEDDDEDESSESTSGSSGSGSSVEIATETTESESESESTSGSSGSGSASEGGKGFHGSGPGSITYNNAHKDLGWDTGSGSGLPPKPDLGASTQGSQGGVQGSPDYDAADDSGSAFESGSSDSGSSDSDSGSGSSSAAGRRLLAMRRAMRN